MVGAREWFARSADRHGSRELLLPPMLGLIKLRVLRGVGLAVRDRIRGTSDPYVIVKMHKFLQYRNRIGSVRRPFSSSSISGALPIRPPPVWVPSKIRSRRRGETGGRERSIFRRRFPSRMERMMGLLRVKVVRGVNLAVRDVRASDPYVVVRLGKHKLKTHVIKKNVNPEWNEELTLSVHDPAEPIRLNVYDKDTFSHDDPMGEAELSVEPFIEAVRQIAGDVPNRFVIRKLTPNRQNCLADESVIYWSDGKVVQDVILRLRNVECGELELQLQWVSIPTTQ